MAQLTRTVRTDGVRGGEAIGRTASLGSGPAPTHVVTALDPVEQSVWAALAPCRVAGR